MNKHDVREMKITHKITKKREDVPITEVAAPRDANMSRVTSENNKNVEKAQVSMDDLTIYAKQTARVSFQSN
jgi:hypothetical protein